MSRLSASLLKWTKRRVAVLVPGVAVALGLVLYLLDPLPVQVARYAVFDQFQRWQPRQYTPAPVRIIDIDEASLARLGQWPWPRTRMAALLERLQAAQAKVVVFDSVFAEPDRTSPKAMLDLWQPPEAVASQIEKLPDHDAVFARVIEKGRVVLGFALERAQRSLQGPPVLKTGFVEINGAAAPYVSEYQSGVSSLPLLVAAAQGYGAISFVPDADGVVRRLPLLMRYGNTLLPSLDAEALRVSQGALSITTRVVPGVGLEGLRVGAVNVPTTPQGEVWMHYTAPVPARYVPAWKVLAGEVPDDELAGKILLIGSSAQGLMDLRFSPLGTVVPGVEIHAQLLEQVLTGGGLSRPTWAEGLEVMLLVASGLLAGAMALVLGPLPAAAIFAALLAFVFGLTWRAFSGHGLLIDPVVPMVTMMLAFAAASIVQHFREERRQRWIRQAFSRYVSPNLVEHLVAHPEALRLSGERQVCSFIFTDLVGSTQLLEVIDPANATTLINRYLDGLIGIAFAHEGTLTRIVGDGLAIMFSAPVHQPDHALRALQCAMQMQHFSHQYAAELQAQGIAFGQTRMGVHSGEVIVGNFGGAHIFDYRALGDPVNTAARLESANRYLGTLVCVSDAVVQACPTVTVRPIGRLLLKGRSTPIAVYEPLPEAVQPDAAYEQAFSLLQSDATAALHAFEVLGEQRPLDALVAMQCTRLRVGQSGDLIVLDSK